MPDATAPSTPDTQAADVAAPAPAAPKLVSQLLVAYSSEATQVRGLRALVAATPPGGFRDVLADHLETTQEHFTRIQERIVAVQQDDDPRLPMVVLGNVAAGYVGALAKRLADRALSASAESRVLKNAHAAAAAEAKEISFYTSLEQLAKSVGDDETAALAASIRSDEEAQLQRVIREIPALTDAVVNVDVDGDPSFAAAPEAPSVVGIVNGADLPVPPSSNGRTPVPAPVRGKEWDSALPFARYTDISDFELLEKLPKLSQEELVIVDEFERSNAFREFVVERIATLRGDEPWGGYDRQTAADIRTQLDATSPDAVRVVLAYERQHKARAGVITAAERRIAKA